MRWFRRALAQVHDTDGVQSATRRGCHGVRPQSVLNHFASRPERDPREGISMTLHSQQAAPTPFLDTANFAARDENISCLSYGVLRKLAGLPPDLFADYWRDVLGPLCARLTGVGYYAQHHFSQDHLANLWPLPDGIRRMDVMLDGAAEIGFADID